MKYNSPLYVDLVRMGLVPLHPPGTEHISQYDKFFSFNFMNVFYTISTEHCLDGFDLTESIMLLDEICNVHHNSVYSIVDEVVKVKQTTEPGIFVLLQNHDDGLVDLVIRTTDTLYAVLHLGFISAEGMFDERTFKISIPTPVLHELENLYVGTTLTKINNIPVLEI